MLYGFHPFSKQYSNNYSIIKENSTKLFFPNDIHVSNLSKDLIKNILVYDSNKRFSLKEINEHPLISGEFNNKSIFSTSSIFLQVKIL